MTLRGVRLGAGCPKICVPIIGKTEGDVIMAAKRVAACGADIAEWRADFYNRALDEDATVSMLGAIRRELGNMPLIYTFRTKSEGGEKDCGFDEYAELCVTAASAKADVVDVQAFWQDDPVEGLVEELYLLKTKILLSHHEFSRTPQVEEMVDCLSEMDKMGGDIIKLAVMPRDSADVLRLLIATDKMKNSACPVVTMSMGRLGAVSRVCGESFGSAMTFGCIGGATSAPGQIEATELAQILKILHH